MAETMCYSFKRWISLNCCYQECRQLNRCDILMYNAQCKDIPARVKVKDWTAIQRTGRAFKRWIPCHVSYIVISKICSHILMLKQFTKSGGEIWIESFHLCFVCFVFVSTGHILVKLGAAMRLTTASQHFLNCTDGPGVYSSNEGDTFDPFCPGVSTSLPFYLFISSKTQIGVWRLS